MISKTGEFVVVAILLLAIIMVCVVSYQMGKSSNCPQCTETVIMSESDTLAVTSHKSLLKIEKSNKD